MTEQQFTNELLKWAKVYKWRVFHVRNSGSAGMTQVQGDRGWPDVILVRGARWIAAELKVEKIGTKRGSARQDQLDWLVALERVGAETFIWHPTEWSQILAELSR